MDKQILSDISKMVAHKRIILVGRAASGKDHARIKFEERGFKYATSFTTRPPRIGEIEGKDYFFLSEEKFEAMIENDEFYEHVDFNNWHYGTSMKQFYENDVFIMTPFGVSKIHPNDRENSLIIFFDIPLEIRRERLMLRSDADKVERRLDADEKDFTNFTDYDIRITDPNF